MSFIGEKTGIWASSNPFDHRGTTHYRRQPPGGLINAPRQKEDWPGAAFRPPQKTKVYTSMKILDFLHTETILTDLAATDKKGVIDEMSLPAARVANIDHREIANVLIERERLGSTGIGDGIGIPHGKVAQLEKLVVGFGLSRRGVDFDTMDGKPAYIFFLLLSPDDSTGLHLMLLARISKLLKNPDFKAGLKKARDDQEVIRIIAEADADS